MFDVLPRIELLRRMKVKIDKLVFNQFKPNPFQKETLSILKIPEQKIIKWQKNFHIKARELVVPSLAGYSFHMPKWTCDFLRKTFLKNKFQQTIKGYERIYISREYTTHRKVLNEESVMNLLANFGFKKVILETLPFSKQIEIFKSAEIIVSAHGSGLTNLVFCKPKTKVLEIFSPNYVQVLYWILCNHVDLDYYYLIGEEKHPVKNVNPVDLVLEDIVVNIDKISEIIKKMLL